MGLLDWLFGKPKKSALRSALPETIATPRSAGSPTTMKVYVSDRFGFAMRCPTDWEVLFENEPADDWIMPIGWASPQKPDGRAGFIVNVKQAEILNKNPAVQVTRFGPDGPIQDPTTPQEFIATAKAGVNFPQLRHESDSVKKIAGFDAAQMTYSYAGDTSRIREMTTTVFGVGMTIQFICEAPAGRFNEYASTFEAMINSFALGDQPAGEEKRTQHDAAADATSMIGLFNQALDMYRRADFKSAESLFSKSYSASDAELTDKMVAAYARGLTQRQLGKDISIPPELQDLTSETGCAYLAYTLAGQLIEDDHRAAISGDGTSFQVDAEVHGKSYRLSISEMMGMFMNSGERIDGSKKVGLGEATSKRNPDKDDVYVSDLLKRVSDGSAPPTRIPVGGFSENL